MNLKLKLLKNHIEKMVVPNKEVHEVTFDTILGIPTYMEVNCVNETALKYTIKLLGSDKMRHGAFDCVYNEYYGNEHNTINYKTSFLTFKI